MRERKAEKVLFSPPFIMPSMPGSLRLCNGIFQDRTALCAAWQTGGFVNEVPVWYHTSGNLVVMPKQIERKEDQ